MAACLLPWVKPQFCDAEGVPVAGGQLFSYVAGTTTLQPTYSDEDLLVANPNPILLNAGGWSPTSIYLSPTGYKFTLRTEDDVPLWTVDDVLAPCGGAAAAADEGPDQDWHDIAYAAGNWVDSNGAAITVAPTLHRWRYVGANAVFWIFQGTFTLPATTPNPGQRMRIYNLPFQLANDQERANVGTKHATVDIGFYTTLIRSATGATIVDLVNTNMATASSSAWPTGVYTLQWNVTFEIVPPA